MVSRPIIRSAKQAWPAGHEGTLWDFRETLIAQLDKALKDARYLTMSGQIVDASLVAAPRQRNADADKGAIKAGKTADEIWPVETAKAAQKDTAARWTVKFSTGEVTADGTMQSDLTIPAFGDKTHRRRARLHPPRDGHGCGCA